MKKTILLIAMLFAFSFVLIACSDDINHVNDNENNNFNDKSGDEIKLVEQGIFVKLELYSASAGTILDHFPKVITVANDGSVDVFTEEMVDSRGRIELKVEDDAPTIEKKISAKEVKEIKQVIEDNRFSSIPKDVTDYGVEDGDGSKITVYGKEQERKVGGENPSHKRYNAIEDIIFSQVKDEYNDWVTETRDYLSELNEQ